MRRRFEFTEIMPDPTLVVSDKFGFNFQDIFTLLNQKISVLHGKDYQIGHSYFMDDKISTIAELKRAWFGSLLPLLNEYFYEEWDKLKALVKGFITESPAVKGLEGVHFGKSELFDFAESDMSDEEFVTLMKSIESAE